MSDSKEDGVETHARLLKRHKCELLAAQKAAVRLGKKRADEAASLVASTNARHAAELAAHAAAAAAHEPEAPPPPAAAADANVEAAASSLAAASLGAEAAAAAAPAPAPKAGPTKAQKRKDAKKKEEARDAVASLSLRRSAALAAGAGATHRGGAGQHGPQREGHGGEGVAGAARGALLRTFSRVFHF